MTAALSRRGFLAGAAAAVAIGPEVVSSALAEPKYASGYLVSDEFCSAIREVQGIYSREITRLLRSGAEYGGPIWKELNR